MKNCESTPCPSCPWRKANPAGGSAIPNFDINMMRNLARTTVPPREMPEADGFFRIMACHHSKQGKEYACAGYMHQQGMQNINARLFVSQNDVDMQKLTENCAGMDLYDNLHDMLADYEKALEEKS